MNKIAVISMVKNESDIIEHFVRHCWFFADIVLIMDHDSCDGTSDILSCLRDEDDRLIIYKCDTMGYVQSEKMTYLMREAALKYGADIIIPLDADEFLLTYSGSDVRNSVMSLPRDTVYSLLLVWYSLDDNTMLSQKFVLSCPSKQLDHSVMTKVLITPGNWDWQNMQLAQGNHYVQYRNHNGWNALETKSKCDLYLAHFAKRSYEQQLSKFIVGWVQNVAKYSKYTYYAYTWGKHYKAFLNDSYNEDENLPVIRSCNRLSDNTCQIKYSNLAHVKSFRNLQITAEKMAHKVAIYECLLAGNKADVIMLYCDDAQNVMISLQSIRLQRYAVDKIFIITKDIRIMQDIKHQFNDMCIIAIPNICDVKKYSQSNYIQLMFAGDEMNTDKISSSMAIISRCPGFAAIYSNGRLVDKNVIEFRIPAESSIEPISGKDLLSRVKNSSKLLSGGIVGFLFKRQLLATVDYMHNYNIDGKPLYWLGVFHMILQCGIVGIIPDRLVKSVVYTDDIVHDYMIQLQVIE